MGARELVKHVLSLVGVAEIRVKRPARLASVTFYESPSAESRRAASAP
jgi:hypothetical protein